MRKAFRERLRITPLNDARLNHVWDQLTRDMATESSIVVNDVTICDGPADVRNLDLTSIDALTLKTMGARFNSEIWVSFSRRNHFTTVETWSDDAVVRQRAADVAITLRQYAAPLWPQRLAQLTPLIALSVGWPIAASLLTGYGGWWIAAWIFGGAGNASG